jgi:hypothetical protein
MGVSEKGERDSLGNGKGDSRMMWGFDLDNAAMLAKERHADMLAGAMRRQRLNRMPAGGEGKHNIWQWLCQVMLGPAPQERPRKPYAAHRSWQHS